MKVITFSKSKSFVDVAIKTGIELKYSIMNITEENVLEYHLKSNNINLLVIDCDTFRPINFNILEYVQNISPKTYCLVIETSLHEIDKDTLFAQIAKQCMLHEIYFYRQFVKKFCKNYSIEVNYDLSNEHKKQENKINSQKTKTYYHLYSEDSSGIVLINENPTEYIFSGISLGFDEKNETANEIVSNIEKYEGLEPTTIKIFEYLKLHLNTPVSIKNICTHIWGENSSLKRKAIYVYIRKLRIYLCDNPEFSTELVKSGKGFYILKKV